MNKATMTVKELAEQLGISIPKAYEIANRPDFPSIKIGTRTIIPVEQFKEWLKKESKAKEGDSDERPV